MKFEHAFILFLILLTFFLLQDKLSLGFDSTSDELYIEEAWREGNRSCVVLNRIATITTDSSNITAYRLCTNTTKVQASYRNLFVNFSFSGLESCKITNLTLEVPSTIESKERFFANLSIDGNRCGIKLLELDFDGTRIKRLVLRPNLTLRIPLSFDRPGVYELRAELDDEKVSREVLVEESRFSFLVPFTLISFFLLFFASLRKELAESLLQFFTLLLGGFTLIPLVVGLAGDDITAPTTFLFFSTSIFYFAFRVRELPTKLQLEKVKLLLVGFAFLTFFTFLPKFIFPSQDTLWNVYYERIARETFYRDGIPSFDPLSYLGRSVTYPRGYFALKASLLRALDLDFNLTSTLLLELLFNFALFIASVSFFEAMGLNPKNALLATLLFCSTIFVYTLLSAHLLHVSSLALLFASLVWLKRRKKLLSLFAISASTLIHPFSLFLYLFFALWLRELGNGFPLALFSLLFYVLFHLDIFFVQTPRVVAPTEWGWLLKGELSGLLVEFGLLFLPSLYLAVKNLLLGTRRKESLLFLALTLIYGFISFRVNLLIALLGAFLLVTETSVNRKFLVVLIPLNFFLSLLLLPNNLGGYVSPELINATSYLGSLSLDSVASHPLYGHYLAYTTDKKVLADLYVEYAKPSLYDAALYFARNGRLSELSPYGIRLGLLVGRSCADSIQLYTNRNFAVCLAIS